jgi:hypothetical protein
MTAERLPGAGRMSRRSVLGLLGVTPLAVGAVLAIPGAAAASPGWRGELLPTTTSAERS